MPESSELLNEAFELIEKGDYAQARFLLQPILDESPDNEDALWVYAHAVEDPEEGRATLLQLKRLNPDYPGLQPMLAQLGLAQTPTYASVEPATANYTQTPQPDIAPIAADFSEDDFDFESVEEETVIAESSGGGRSCLYLVLAGLVILIVTLLILNAAGILQPADGEPQVADNPTATVDQAPQATADTQADTQSVATEPFNATSLATSLENVDLAEQGVELSETALGQTIIVYVCQLPGPNATDTIRTVFETVAQQAALGDATSIGVGLTDCSTNSVLRSLGTSIDAAKAFSQGESDETTFESTWQPF